MDLEIELDPQITVVIGPNESGKTNVLKALESFNPEVALTNDNTCQYSTFYDEGKYPEISLEFSDIEPRTRNSLAKISPEFKDRDTIKVCRTGPGANDYQVILDGKVIPIKDCSQLLKSLPTNIYFSEISLLKSTVRLQELESEDKRFQCERDMLQLGGVTEHNEIFEDSTRGRRRREEISRFLTEQIREVWSQDRTLELKLNVNGEVLHIDISDETTVFDSINTRSLGFWWFISFYIAFMTRTVNPKQSNFIYLVEEPGIHLHPSGQKDLVRLLEMLSQKNQIIYTTHSPFMLNRAYPNRVRLVSKTRKGTEVDNEAYRENWKPLRSSIGLMIGDLFFFGNSGVLLEVPTKKIPFMSQMKSINLWGQEEDKN
jgi:predicted ATPase